MEIKSEIEIKMEELVSENDFSEEYQSFPHIESDISLPERIKEELDQMTSFTIKSEAGESEIEFGVDEEQVKKKVIKSENSAMITKFNAPHKFMSVKNVSSLVNKVNENGLKAHFESDEEEYFAQILTSKFPLLLLKFTYTELKSLIINAAEGEDLEVKSTSRSKPLRRAAVVHQQSIKKNHVEKLSCRYCKFSFKSKEELKTHLKTHNKRKFKCAHCSYESNLKSVLKIHLLTHSNTKLYKCSDCSYECNRRDKLKTHMLTHTNVKLFKCSDCSFECNRVDILKRHMLTHTNVKLFKCSDCSYECNQKEHLKTHILTHTNVKLFKCSYCSYECIRKDMLKSHMLAHTNVNLFKCSDCSYECNRKSNLKTHILTHTNVKLFKCSYCSYECNQKGNLKKHILAHKVSLYSPEV
ncbi:UNVERIFIED_CONTAM: hypothetical protein RMT77_017647 [Armadillidium vulgare]